MAFEGIFTASLARAPVIASVIVGLLVGHVVTDFYAWKSNGTGGTPSTWKGYYKIRRWGLYLTFRGQNLLDASNLPVDGPSYLHKTQLAKRAGQRPKLTRWTLPQRQHPSPIDPTTLSALNDLMQHLASSATFSSSIHTAPSKTEGGTGPAIYVNPSVPTINPNAHKIFYEVAHVHPSEHSLHVYLSPADARLVVEQGWGELFPVDWLAPSSWIMVYAPRDIEEFGVIETIVRAAVKFSIGAEGNKE